MQQLVHDFGHQSSQASHHHPQSHQQQLLQQSHPSHQMATLHNGTNHSVVQNHPLIDNNPHSLPHPQSSQPHDSSLPPPSSLDMSQSHLPQPGATIPHGCLQPTPQTMHQQPPPGPPTSSHSVHHQQQQSINKAYGGHDGYDGSYIMLPHPSHTQHQHNMHQQHQQHHPQHYQPSMDKDSDDGCGNHSGDDLDDGDDNDVARLGKRKRPTMVSCEVCKQRKVKCDRIQPSCSWCSKNGVNCEYRQRKKPGLRAGYGRELEQRLDHLEKQLIEHKETMKHHAELINNLSPSTRTQPSVQLKERSRSTVEFATPGGTASSAVMAIPVTTSGTQQPTDSRTPSTADTPLKPKSEFGAYNGYATQQPIDYPRYYTSVHAEYPGHSPIEYTKIANTHLMNSGDFPIQQSPSQNLSSVFMGSEPDLPPYAILYSIIDRYFSHINTWCPILHRKTTLDCIFSKPLEEPDRVLLHAILATTLRYCDDLNMSTVDRERYYTISKQRVLLYGMEKSSIRSIQALVILALDLVGKSNGCPGRNVLALLARSVVQLGLAVEISSHLIEPSNSSIYTLRTMVLHEPTNFIEEEARRRVFWMVYLLDRYATTATAFDFVLGDHEIDRMLPCKDELWDRNAQMETRFFYTSAALHPGRRRVPNYVDNMGAFAYYLEILGVLSKIHQFLKKPVDIQLEHEVKQWQKTFQELCDEFIRWKQNLPQEYGDMSRLNRHSTKLLSPSWVMLHAAYQTTVIRLNSSAAYPTTVSPYFQVSRIAAARCLDAVREIQTLARFVVDQRMLSKLGPPFAFTLWVAARVILVDGTTITGTIDEELGFFTDTLREMGRYWPVSKRYSELLQRVLDEYHENPGEKPAAVQILADMRRTAFDLDILLSCPQTVLTDATPAPNNLGSTSTNLLPRSRGNSTTPSRPIIAPAVDDFDYYDVFGFFNYPRLIAGDLMMQGMDAMVTAEGQMAAAAAAAAVAVANTGAEVVTAGMTAGLGDFGVQGFIGDATGGGGGLAQQQDWLYR